MRKILLTLTLPFAAGILCSNGIFASSSSDNVESEKVKAAKYRAHVKYMGDLKDTYESDLRDDAEELEGIITGNEEEDAASSEMLYYLDLLTTCLIRNVRNWDDQEMKSEGLYNAIVKLYLEIKQRLAACGPETPKNAETRKLLSLLKEILVSSSDPSEEKSELDDMARHPEGALQRFITKLITGTFSGHESSWKKGSLTLHRYSFVKDLLWGLPGHKRMDGLSFPDNDRSELARKISDYLLTPEGLDAFNRRIGEVDAKFDIVRRHGMPDPDAAEEKK